jgi:site-specific DNA-methyltransferase (adenine-specific)
MRALVKICEPGGRVLDPFAGSGSTLVAAELEGYDWCGCEISSEYAEVIARRLADLPGVAREKSATC